MRFIFQISTKKFRLYGALGEMRNKSQSDNLIVLSPKPESPNNPSLQSDAVVYLWEAGKPQRDLVARGVVINPREERDMPLWQHKFCRGPHKPGLPRSVIRIEH